MLSGILAFELNELCQLIGLFIQHSTVRLEGDVKSFIFKVTTSADFMSAKYRFSY